MMASSIALETALEFATRFGLFVDNSPTPYHVCREVSARLVGSGFVRLLESQSWKDVSVLFIVSTTFCVEANIYIEKTTTGYSSWRKVLLHEKLVDPRCVCGWRTI